MRNRALDKNIQSRKEHRLKKKFLLYGLISAAFLVSNVSTALAQTSKLDQTSNETKLYFQHGKHSGNFSMRYWYGNNSVDQWFKGEGLDVFSNTKLSAGILEINTDYWFGFMTPQGLGQLGSVFGLGLSAAYSDFLVQGVRVNQYWFDVQFAKLNLIQSADKRHSLTLTGDYISYFNSMYDNMLLTTAAPFFGVGAGVESKLGIGDVGQLSFKLLYVPSARTPNPLPDGLGLNSELNTRWFIGPRMAFNVGYRFNYFRASGPSQAVSTATGQPISINRTLEDMFHGLMFGFTHYF